MIVDAFLELVIHRQPQRRGEVYFGLRYGVAAGINCVNRHACPRIVVGPMIN